MFCCLQGYVACVLLLHVIHWLLARALLAYDMRYGELQLREWMPENHKRRDVENPFARPRKVGAVLQLQMQQILRKVGVSIKFMSAKFGFTFPPRPKKPNEEKLYKSVDSGKENSININFLVRISCGHS